MSINRILRVAGVALMLGAIAPVAESQAKGKSEERGKGQQAQGRGQAAAPGQQRAQEQGRGQSDAARPQQAQGRGQAAAPGQQRAQQAPGRGQASAPGQQRAEQGRGQAAAPGQQRAQQAPGRGQASAPGQQRAQQGRGQATAPGQQRAQDRVVAEAAGAVAPSRGRWVRDLTPAEVRPTVRPLFTSNRVSHRLAGHAVGLAHARGVSENALVFLPQDDRVVIRNRDGVVLLDWNDQRARNLGFWRVVALDDRVRGNAPAFCRSGAGHPVWGRQWCIDRGWGLGSYNNIRWGRSVDPVGVILRRPATTGDLTRDLLLGVLGQVGFDRLAAHALTMGLVDPLVGRWMGEPTGPQVLLVTSGAVPVAEFVDLNRDGHADVMYVGLRSW